MKKLSLSGNTIYMQLLAMKGFDAIRPEYNRFISMIISVDTLCGFAPLCTTFQYLTDTRTAPFQNPVSAPVQTGIRGVLPNSFTNTLLYWRFYKSRDIYLPTFPKLGYSIQRI